MKNTNALKFVSNGVSVISLTKNGNYRSTHSISLEYSYDGVDWNDWDLNALTLNSGDALYIRGNNPDGFSCNDVFYMFVIEGDKVSCSGNIMSLVDYENLPDIIPCDICFYGLFENCSLLTTAPELPATKLTRFCYSYMFSGCYSLITAPELPATKLADYCYYQMFSYCSSLKTAPELPATNLAEHCYSNMFNSCSSLTIAPELPATILTDFCYAFMFKDCTSLAKAPDLPAKTLAERCYFLMFDGCTLLKDKK